MRRVIIPALCLVMAVGAWAVDEESAKEAIGRAFPDAPYARQAAVFGLLNTLEDGDRVMVMINDEVGSFAIRDGRVILQRFPELPGDVRQEGETRLPEGVSPPEKPKDVPRPPEPPRPKAEFRAAMAVKLDLAEPLNLDLLRAEIEGAGRRIAVSTPDATSFYMATEGDFVTVTARGTVGVRTQKRMHTLEVVDQMKQELKETLGYVADSNERVDSADVERAMTEPAVYSDPAKTMHRVAFSGQDGRWMSPRFSATVQVPGEKIADARLLVHILREDDIFRGVDKVAPDVILNGNTVVEPRAKVTDYRADITGHIKPGGNTLSVRVTSTAADIATGCRFAIELAYEEPVAPPITVTVPGGVTEGLPSGPMSALQADYPAVKVPR